MSTTVQSPGSVKWGASDTHLPALCPINLMAKPPELLLVWHLISMGLRRWTGGRYGVGSRIKLRYTRAIIDGIHSGELKTAETTATPTFNLAVRAAACLLNMSQAPLGPVPVACWSATDTRHPCRVGAIRTFCGMTLLQNNVGACVRL